MTQKQTAPKKPRHLMTKEERCMEEAAKVKHIVLPWVDSLEALQVMPGTSNGIHICEDKFGVHKAYIRLGADYEYELIVDVLFGHPTERPSWHGLQAGENTWNLFPSLHMPEVFHCFAIITGVPEPAPWVEESGWFSYLAHTGNVFIAKCIGSVKGDEVRSDN